MTGFKVGDRVRLADAQLKGFGLTVEEPLREQPSPVMIIYYQREFTVQFDDGEMREGVLEGALERESNQGLRPRK